MHIAINAHSFLLPQYTGIGRYALNLIRSLVEIDSENQYSLYARKKIFDRKKRVPRIDAKNLMIRNDYFGLGPANVIPHIDIYHCPAPEVCPVKRKKLVVTIHDLVYKAFPDGHTEDACKKTDKQIRSLIPHTDKFICCSKSTKADLIKYFDVPPEKAAVVYQGVDHDMFYPVNDIEMQAAVARLKEMGIKTDFILFVGTVEPRKNLPQVLKAFADLHKRKVFNGQLVIAGMMGWKSENIHALLMEYNINPYVVFLGYVQDFELRYLYNCCEVFVFPSMYEGFGFPILEALCCGAPVVTSNVSSCPEVGGDAALTVDPRNSGDISAKIENVIKSEDLREEMSRKGFEQSAKFSFRKTAQDTLNIYKETGKG